VKDLPDGVKQHLVGLAREQGQEEDEAYLANLVAVWKRKASLFEDQAHSVHLDLVDSVPGHDPRGALVLTYSGSLLSIGPATNRTLGRWLEYSSIKLRTEVPDVVIDRGISVPKGIRVGEPVEIDGSQVSRTSNAYSIALCPTDLEEDEQERRIRESTIFIANGFMKYNRNVHTDGDAIPDQFTMKSMTRYLAKKHGLTGQEARALIDDFLTLVETGMLLGDSVSLGRLGRVSIKVREAQKARVVKHPSTGEEMVVDPKPPRGVPKISFSTQLKARAEGIGDEER
jgi:nucleoid DNA-binding protein